MTLQHCQALGITHTHTHREQLLNASFTRQQSGMVLNTLRFQHVNTLVCYLKVVIFLLPDARCGIETCRSQVVPAWGPGNLSNCALVSVWQHTLANPRLSCAKSANTSGGCFRYTSKTTICHYSTFKLCNSLQTTLSEDSEMLHLKHHVELTDTHRKLTLTLRFCWILNSKLPLRPLPSFPQMRIARSPPHEASSAPLGLQATYQQRESGWALNLWRRSSVSFIASYRATMLTSSTLARPLEAKMSFAIG